MATDSITGTFPIGTATRIHTTKNVNLRSLGASLGWTRGASLVVPVTSQPTLEYPWRILGWSISYNGYYGNQQEHIAENSGPAARLGRLIAGIIPGTVEIPSRESLVFPLSRSFLATAWDGNESPMWRNFNSLPESGGINIATEPPLYDFGFELKQPITLHNGEFLSVGIWLSPMLIMNFELILIIDSATWSILYEQLSR